MLELAAILWSHVALAIATQVRARYAQLHSVSFCVQVGLGQPAVTVRRVTVVGPSGGGSACPPEMSRRISLWRVSSLRGFLVVFMAAVCAPDVPLASS
jgi:hypothetical protein